MELLSKPWLFYSVAVLLLLGVLRSRLLWTRAGGVLLLLFLIAFAGWGRDRLSLSPGGLTALPALAFVVLSLGSLWLAMRHAPGDERKAGFSRGELAAGAGTIVAVVSATLLLDLPAPTPIGPSSVLDSVRLPWFLAGLGELERYFDPWVPGTLVPALVLGALLVLPWIDDGPDEEVRPTDRGKIGLFFFLWSIVGALPMSMAIFLPQGGGELPPGVSFSEMFWIGWLGWRMPVSWLFRELPGWTLLGFYFVLLPGLLTRWKPTRSFFARAREQLGSGRYYALMAVVLLTLSLPLKMYGRWFLGLTTFLDLSEFGLRF